jgi:transposase
MLTDGLAGARVFVRPGVTDMRKQINGLSVLVEQELELDPFEHAVFLFCNRQRRILKAIYWDRTGFAMWMKRLEGRARFPWPESGAQAVREIDIGRLQMLLSGIDFWRAHQRISAKKVS